LELRFWAAVHSIESGEERLATFYLMDTSLNRNRWRVTDRALEEATPTLVGKALGCIPGHRVDHVHEPLQVGRWVRVEKPDGYALATAEITDDVAWEKVRGGEWGPVSVVVRAFRVTCSLCGRDITGAPDEHVLAGEAHEVVESFAFDRVDFVADPAYPQAGVLTLGHAAGAGGAGGVLLTAASVPFEETVRAPVGRPWDGGAAEDRVRRWAGGPEKEGVDWSMYRRAFAWYHREDPEDSGSYGLPHHDVVNGRLSVVWRGVAAAMQALLGARGGVDIPARDRRSVWSHLARHYRQFEREPPEFHASRSTGVDGAQGPRGNPKPDEMRENEMRGELAELQHELEDLQAENADLRRKLERIEAERHRELVDAALEARLRAGIGDRKAEAGRLKGLDDTALVILREDAERVAERMARAPPHGPKARYSAEARSGLDAAVEEMRERIFGRRLEVDG